MRGYENATEQASAEQPFGAMVMSNISVPFKARWQILCFLAVSGVLALGLADTGSAQDTSGGPEAEAYRVGDDRSFHNNSEPVAGDSNRALRLIFAEAVFTFDVASDGTLTGDLDWGSGVLDLSGTVEQSTESEAPTVSIVGLGREGTQIEGWRYDYKGSLVHHWQNGVEQVPSLTGSVIRVEPSDGAPAGYVASFIAVKRP